MVIEEDSVFTKVISEDVHIISDANVVITGISNGNIFVEDASNLTLSGIANKDIEISENARSTITGIVNGSVINLGGKVRITGIVSSIEGKPNSVLVEKDSVIDGKKMPVSQMLPY